MFQLCVAKKSTSLFIKKSICFSSLFSKYKSSPSKKATKSVLIFDRPKFLASDNPLLISLNKKLIFKSKLEFKTISLVWLQQPSKTINVSKFFIVCDSKDFKALISSSSCKSLLLWTQIKTVNISKSYEEKFEFNKGESSIKVNYCEPKKYLYEPNAAIMKSGGFNEVAFQFNLNKLHPHSHLYTSDEKLDFCGRVFEITTIIPYQKKEMKLHLENKKANITSRNFPETVETIRKKWRIKEGGELFCFFTTDLNNNKIVLLCKKLK